MRSRSNSSRTQRGVDCAQSVDPQRNHGGGPNILYIVGIGPGHPEHLSQRAKSVLQSVDVIVGYTTYIGLIEPLIKEKIVISTGMKKEVDRVGAAIRSALNGKKTALISSGDPGIYAMAGLAFEMCHKNDIRISGTSTLTEEGILESVLKIEVVPGIPALCSGAALLGAPLTHDFAAISLSDLLTPWESIAKRLDAAARADFVIVLYNPKSKKRSWQLTEAQKIILKSRSPQTPVGIVSRAMREGETVQIVPLANLHTAPVDMLSTVFIGNSATFNYLDHLITPRGYTDKYDLDQKGETD